MSRDERAIAIIDSTRYLNNDKDAMIIIKQLVHDKTPLFDYLGDETIGALAEAASGCNRYKEIHWDKWICVQAN